MVDCKYVKQNNKENNYVRKHGTVFSLSIHICVLGLTVFVSSLKCNKRFHFSAMIYPTIGAGLFLQTIDLPASLSVYPFHLFFIEFKLQNSSSFPSKLGFSRKFHRPPPSKGSLSLWEGGNEKTALCGQR